MSERQRIGLPITGLDTSTPDHSVTDGKCSTLHNLRYTADAWRNVKNFAERVAPSLDDRTIAYHHPADTDNAYITANTDNGLTLYRSVFTNAWSHTRIYHNAEINDYSLHHFGTILLIADRTNKRFISLILDNQTYHLYEANKMLLNLSVDWGESYKSEGVTASYDTIQEYIYSNLNGNETQLATYDREHNQWRGELAIFATIEDNDGSVLFRSEPQILNTCQIGNSDFDELVSIHKDIAGNPYPIITCYDNPNVNSVTITHDFHIVDGTPQDLINNGSPYMRLYRPTITLTINEAVMEAYERKLCTSVKLWVTRIYPPFDIEKLKGLATDSGYQIPARNACTAFADNKLFNEPFYLYKTLDINSFPKESVGKLEAYTAKAALWGRDLIDNAIHGTLYTATQSLDSFFSDTLLEYNNRMHLLGVFSRADISSDINARLGNDTTADGNLREIIIERSQGLSTYRSKHTVQEYKNNHPSAIQSYSYFANQQPFLLTAPSASAARLIFANGNTAYGTFLMESATSLALSIYIQRNDSGWQPYRDILVSQDGGNSYDISDWTFSDFIYNSNRIQVSQLNTPLSYPYENSYQIGSQSNSIIAADAAAMEISDAKTGEFPLFVFTKEGVFAMQLGTEALYAQIRPRLAIDNTINPNTLPVNQSILYITERGISALSNDGTALISTPIHLADGRMPEWMKTTKMIYLPEWNEVLCTDLEHGLLYIFSLTTQTWSTRDIPQGYILNNNEMVFTQSSYGIRLLNLRSEQEATPSDGTHIAITTRPIKLGSMELKRAETIIVRFECTAPQTLNIKIEGSTTADGTPESWITLREGTATTNKDIVIRRTPCSVKYLRFSLEGTATADIRILAFELEYYLRMRHRMR